MASLITAYGVVLAALGVLIHQISQAFAQIIFITGMAGGGLCVLWGIIAFAGHKRRAWTVLTMIAVALAVLTQVVQAWLTTDATSASLTGRIVLTLMLLMTIGMLMYVLHGERPPEFYDPGAARRGKDSLRGEHAQPPAAGHHP